MGLSPTTPQNAAGCRTEPPVSEPSPHTASPAATAAAEPPLEPPGTRVVSHNYDMGDWKPERTIKLNLQSGEHTVYFWTVPTGGR